MTLRRLAGVFRRKGERSPGRETTLFVTAQYSLPNVYHHTTG